MNIILSFTVLNSVHMVMHLVKLVQILLLVAVANRCVGEDCIESFLDLESSILTDEFNIQSLIHAFFPANHYPALVVEVHYYVNESNNGGLFYHPIQPQASEDNFFADYIFSWVSSPGLLYGDPNILEGLSLRSLAIDYHYAHLVILPFCSDDNELDKKYILGLLNNVTIWVGHACICNYTIVLKMLYCVTYHVVIDIQLLCIEK